MVYNATSTVASCIGYCLLAYACVLKKKIVKKAMTLEDSGLKDIPYQISFTSAQYRFWAHKIREISYDHQKVIRYLPIFGQIREIIFNGFPLSRFPFHVFNQFCSTLHAEHWISRPIVYSRTCCCENKFENWRRDRPFENSPYPWRQWQPQTTSSLLDCSIVLPRVTQLVLFSRRKCSLIKKYIVKFFIVIGWGGVQNLL